MKLVGINTKLWNHVLEFVFDLLVKTCVLNLLKIILERQLHSETMQNAENSNDTARINYSVVSVTKELIYLKEREGWL